MLLFADESHDIFNAGAVVPASVEDHDFARCRKMLDVALNIHLGLFAIRWSRERDDAKDARAYPLREGLDGTALPRGVTTFEYDDDSQSLLLDPFLQMAQADLEFV